MAEAAQIPMSECDDDRAGCPSGGGGGTVRLTAPAVSDSCVGARKTREWSPAASQQRPPPPSSPRGSPWTTACRARRDPWGGEAAGARTGRGAPHTQRGQTPAAGAAGAARGAQGQRLRRRRRATPRPRSAFARGSGWRPLPWQRAGSLRSPRRRRQRPQRRLRQPQRRRRRSEQLPLPQRLTRLAFPRRPLPRPLLPVQTQRLPLLRRLGDSSPSP